jgi:ribonuclease R
MPTQSEARPVTHAALLDVLQRPDYSPLTLGELAAALELQGKQRRHLARLLHQMVMNGEIVIIRRNRYSLGRPADLATGRLEVKRSGDGYLTDIEGDLDVRIPKGDLGTALPGDRVVVRLDPDQRPGQDRRKVGKVIRVLERGKRVIVGTLKTTERFHYVVPLDPSYQQDFYVADAAGGRVGDRVVIQFANWENRHVNPEAEIVEVIGPADNPTLDTLAVIRHFELREAFPGEALREAEGAAARLEHPGRREDLRGRFIFTVDPATARDFDDALSLERDGEGRRVLGVHIADVSHFVHPGGPLDREALARGNSVYLPDRVLPMLPEQLSNGLCSLKPGQDRLAFSAFLTLDDSGRVVQSRFARSVIRSALRLTYEQAYAVIRTPPGMRCRDPGVPAEAVPLIRDIGDLAQQMRALRMADGALDLDVPECEVIMGADGMIADIRRLENDLSHQMIEECMVAANEAVDRELSRRGIPLIHRLHEPPAVERLESLAVALRDLGYQPGNLTHLRHLRDFLHTIKGTPLADAAETAVLRSMKRAVYSATDSGHFGLAKKHYTHFTSPIRRYPDLVVHRILGAVLEGRALPHRGAELDRIALHCSWTEQTAEEAERELIEIKKYRFLEQQLRREAAPVYDAVVTHVTNFGMFVELLQLEIEGLVHISAVSDRFVRHDPGAKALRAGARVFRVGTPLRARVTGVDFDKRRIDLALHDEGNVPAGGAGRPTRRAGPMPRKRARSAARHTPP